MPFTPVFALKTHSGICQASRKVRYYDTETDNSLVFLTNNLLLPAVTIAQFYKQRWQVKLLLKWKIMGSGLEISVFPLTL
jgi:hypothetical protein